ASLVAIDTLAALVAFLRLDRERGNGARLEPLERDWLAGLFAVAVGAVVEASERGVDFGDQLALAGARPQFHRPGGLRGGAVGEVGMVLVLGLQMRQCLSRLLEDLLLPGHELLAEILPLSLVHERLFVGRSIRLGPVLYRAAVFLRHCNPVQKRSPYSRGELISTRARPDNNGIAAGPTLDAMQKNCGGGAAAAARVRRAYRRPLALALHRPDRVGVRASCRCVHREADEQVGKLLERDHARARGQAKDVAAARLVGAEKMEMPAGHVDRAVRGHHRAKHHELLRGWPPAGPRRAHAGASGTNFKARRFMQ